MLEHMNDPTGRRPGPASAPGDEGPGRVCVVFDLDGTLVDSEPNYFEASRRTLAAHGVADFGWDDHESCIGVSTLETLTRWKQRWAIETPLDELLADMDRRYLQLAAERTRVFPRMRVFVERLHAAGVPMIVASGSSREAIKEVLTATGLDAWLPFVSSDEVDRGKPAPDVFLEAACRLGAVPGDCVVVEDAPPGALAARAAGMRCIAVPYVASHADDPAFRSADLLFRGGQREFTAEAAWDWLARTSHRGTS